MPITCAKGTSGGKGNEGLFIERDKNVCAAGLPTIQPEETVKRNLEHYLLQEEVDALIGDSIKPPPKVTSLPPLRHPIPRDMRNAGSFSDGALLINPLKKTKFQVAVEDLKQSCYESYWNKQVGKGRDPVNLPPGYDIYGTTAGKKTEFRGTLYDIVMPKNPVPGELPKSRSVAYQTDRNYCKPAYNPNIIFGMKANVDNSGRSMRCCLTDDKVGMGTAWAKPINTIQANFMQAKQAELARSTAPNNNASCVPKGFTFGKTSSLDPSESVAQCVSLCELNPDRMFFKKCLGHLNTLRKCISKRFDGSFFSKLYLNLKYYDKEHTGWLPKEIVYKYCATKYIRFNSTLIEPLLSTWGAFDGSNIEYKKFILILNFTQSLPDLPKVQDIADECIDFRTTYQEMVKPGQEIDKRRMAGLPSGRYFDMDYPVTPNDCCKADRFYLPHESDARACLCPSVITNLGVSHREMYANREPHVIKRVFEASGDVFTDEEFNFIWEAAKKYHPKEYVSYETFYRALKETQSQKGKK